MRKPKLEIKESYSEESKIQDIIYFIFALDGDYGSLNNGIRKEKGGFYDE